MSWGPMDEIKFLLPISELISTPQVYYCSPSTPLSEVVGLVVEAKIGSVVVMEGDELVGIFTERDYIVRIAQKEIDLKDSQVGDFMTKAPKSLPLTASIKEAIVCMHEGKYRHMIVVDENQAVKGVISIRDIIAFICNRIFTIEAP